MRITNFALVTLAVLLTSGCVSNRPTSLKCEYQEGLVLIDTDAPRLSWINSCGQTAWQVKVAAKAGKEVKSDGVAAGEAQADKQDAVESQAGDAEDRKEAAK